MGSFSSSTASSSSGSAKSDSNSSKRSDGNGYGQEAKLVWILCQLLQSYRENTTESQQFVQLVESFDMRKRNTCFSIDWINSKNLVKLKWHCFKSQQNQLNFTNFVAHFREMKIMYRVSQQVWNEFHKIFAIEASTVLQKYVFLRKKIAF